MKRSEIEELAWRGEALPKAETAENAVIYCISCAAFSLFKAETISKQDAQNLKLKAMNYFDTVQMLARSNSAIIRTIATATAPRADLVKKSKVQLLDYIAKIESVAAGLIKTMDEETPEFMKLEVEK